MSSASRLIALFLLPFFVLLVLLQTVSAGPRYTKRQQKLDRIGAGIMKANGFPSQDVMLVSYDDEVRKRELLGFLRKHYPGLEHDIWDAVLLNAKLSDPRTAMRRLLVDKPGMKWSPSAAQAFYRSIVLGPKVLDRSDEEVAIILSHELGHVYDVQNPSGKGPIGLGQGMAESAAMYHAAVDLGLSDAEQHEIRQEIQTLARGVEDHAQELTADYLGCVIAGRAGYFFLPPATTLLAPLEEDSTHPAGAVRLAFVEFVTARMDRSRLTALAAKRLGPMGVVVPEPLPVRDYSDRSGRTFQPVDIDLDRDGWKEKVLLRGTDVTRMQLVVLDRQGRELWSSPDYTNGQLAGLSDAPPFLFGVWYGGEFVLAAVGDVDQDGDADLVREMRDIVRGGPGALSFTSFEWDGSSFRVRSEDAAFVESPPGSGRYRPQALALTGTGPVRSIARFLPSAPGTVRVHIADSTPVSAGRSGGYYTKVKLGQAIVAPDADGYHVVRWEVPPGLVPQQNVVVGTVVRHFTPGGQGGHVFVHLRTDEGKNLRFAGVAPKYNPLPGVEYLLEFPKELYQGKSFERRGPDRLIVHGLLEGKRVRVEHYGQFGENGASIRFLEILPSAKRQKGSR